MKIIVVSPEETRQEVEKLRAVWIAAKTELDELVAECSRNKTTPGANYWQTEFAARKKYEAAMAVYGALFA